ncbi:MAG: LytTR family DNA-binding domain-containing protein [Bacteroidota bacterium]
MIQAILIDDEQDALEMLEWQLKNYCPQVEIAALCRSADEGIDAIRIHAPQLVFLDIEMPHKNGFEVIRSFPDPRFDIVFTTAYNQFAVDAFKVAALDYLLKPIDADDLVKSISRFEKKQKELGLKHQLETLMKEYQPYKMPVEKIPLSTINGILFTDPSTITRCESSGNYTIIFFNDNKKMTLSKTLKDIEELLRKQRFARIHHSHLINMDFVSKYIKAEGGMVEMNDGTKIPISRQRKDAFVQLFLTDGH